MALAVAEIAAVVQEIAPAVTDGAIQKIFQPTLHAIILEIRKPGRTVSLLLSVDPETSRLHVITRRPSNPPTPPPFCQFLRAHIEGARIDEVEQLRGDRIVRFRLTTRTGPLILIAELTGRSADLLLLDSAENVMGALHDAGENAGRPYQPPAIRTRTDRDVDSEPPTPDEDHPFPVSWSIERRYQQREEERVRNRLRQARLVELRKAIKKTTRRIEGLQADLDKAARYRDYARYGELLKAYLKKIAKGQDRITVED